MAFPRTLPSILRHAVLSLIATSAFAGGPWFRGGPPAARGGAFHGGGGVRGGFVAGGVHGGAYRAYGSVHVLPRGYLTYHHGGSPWFMAGGSWYRPWRGAYLGCYPPLGLYLDVLPFGFSTVWYGGARYYAYEDVYYTDGPSGGYTVVDPPDREDARRSAPAPEAAGDALLVIPKEGQTADRMKADRADAQSYARRKSGYDPALADPTDPGTPRARRAYQKALKAYLEDKGYLVE